LVYGYSNDGESSAADGEDVAEYLASGRIFISYIFCEQNFNTTSELNLNINLEQYLLAEKQFFGKKTNSNCRL